MPENNVRILIAIVTALGAAWPAGHVVLADADRLRSDAELRRQRGVALGFIQELDAAEASLRAAIVELRRQRGPLPPELAHDLKFLASLYRARDKEIEAEALLRWAIELLENDGGPMQADVATALLQLGDLYFDQERFVEAENAYAQALTIREQILGPDHPGVAEGLDHVAILLRRTGRSERGAALERRAAEIRDRLAALLDAPPR